MVTRLLFIFCLALLSGPVLADPLVSKDPQCATLVNTADVRIYGTVRSDYYTDEAGVKRRHEVQFRLEPKGDQQICSTGPFYAGYTVALSLRTLMPVFQCKTRLAGKIYLHADKQPDESTKLYADCVGPSDFVSEKFQVVPR